MEKHIFLRCLRKDSEPSYVVRVIKKHGGEMEIDKLREFVKNPTNALTILLPAVSRKGSKVLLSPEYDFVISEKVFINHLQNRCHKYNRKLAKEEEQTAIGFFGNDYLIF